MCGVVGIFGHPEAANLTYLGLYALQHRGQESAGIASFNRKDFYLEKALREEESEKTGFAVFTKEQIKKLLGPRAIGHIRYSTTGGSSLENVQPIETKHSRKRMAICHNGNLVNALPLKRELEGSGSIFKSSSDTELIPHLIAKSKKETFIERLSESLLKVKGAFSLLILTKDELVAVRDPLGFRPLCLGKLDGAYVLASESCAFDVINAEYIREVKPGEILMINKDGIKSYFPFVNPGRTAHCIFELIYFSKPDSRVFINKLAYYFRNQLGVELAREEKEEKDLIETDFVVPIPDSANRAALGYSWESKIPLDFGIIRNHYVGRTFIEPRQIIRDFGTRLKFNAIPEINKGKNITVFDDSIVRGTTSEKIVRMFFSVEVKEVHFRVSCPPNRFPCYFGIDMPDERKFIANGLSIEQIRKKIGATSLRYLSLEGMHRALKISGFSPKDFCDACFTGDYPIKIPKDIGKFNLE